MGATGNAGATTAVPPRGGFLPISRQEMLAEIDRELSVRARVYPGQYAKRKLDRQTGERRIAVLEAVRAALEEAAPASDLARVVDGVAAGVERGGLRLDEVGAVTPQGWRLRAIIAVNGDVESRVAATIQKLRDAWAVARKTAAAFAEHGGDGALID